MKCTKLIMDMPIEIEIADKNANEEIMQNVFSFFQKIDKQFSTFKPDSETSKINAGNILPKNYSSEMKDVLKTAEKTKRESYGFFNIERSGKIDPLGIVKGWAVFKAGKLLLKRGFRNFCINAGGDIQIYGKNKSGKKWQVGIRNPFAHSTIIKTLNLTDCGIATSGNYIRGNHIYNPYNLNAESEIVSLTVIAENILEADRFATAAFAMGRKGIYFLEKYQGLEGYTIDKNGVATYTSGFNKYVA